MLWTISRRKLLGWGAALPLWALEGKGRRGSVFAPAFSLSSMTQALDTPLPYVVNLDGAWDFTYDPDPPKKNTSGEPGLPDEKSFVAKLPVPGYWDDHLDLLRTAPFWSSTRFNPQYRKIEFPLGEGLPDATLPYLIGVGWYRKVFDAPVERKSRLVTLHVGGCRLEAWVWLNGNLLGHHVGHSVPFEMALDKWLRPGASNTLIVAVDNRSEERGGTSLRGYQGRTAGVYRPVFFTITGDVRIKSCYLRFLRESQRIAWSVELEARDLGPDILLHWTIWDPEGGRTLGEGTTAAQASNVQWETGTFEMRSWSDHTPALYEVEVRIEKAGVILDRYRQSYGLRLLERNGIQLRLNGRPIMLRGGTDSYYFPLTTLAPENVEAYRDRIRKLKEVGFNWIRFHTWVPSVEYMQAADELGMMLQVEAPVGSSEQEWIDILRTCRTHPSVVIYCSGNEENLDEHKIAFLRKLASDVHREVPDALFNPQEALTGVEYGWGAKDEKNGLGPGTAEKPFPHNPRRLALLKEFSDVFGSFAWGMLSYQSLKGDWRTLDERMGIYERPILSHELGIHGNYLDLDLEHRFAGTRIGPDLFAAVRRYLSKEGLLSKAELYYRNSCAWMRILRKETVEMARKVKYLAGYDFLGPLDQNWLYSGYPCGIMNDFLELKPGECVRDVLKYNGESVLLLDCTNQRNFFAGDRLEFDVLASLYGSSSLAEGTLNWRLADSEGKILRRGGWALRRVRNGVIETLGKMHCVTPELRDPTKVTLFVDVSGGEYELGNNWDFWVFPKSRPIESGAAADGSVFSKLAGRYRDLRPVREAQQAALRVLSTLDEESLQFLEKGGRALLLGQGTFPALPTSFQMSVTGRIKGNLASIIHDHPLMRSFPHDGYCDWQFYSLLERGSAVNFNKLNVPFDPIIEIVSSFKSIIKQANLFEWRVGVGRLLVSTLNLDLSDPATTYLLDRMIEYVKGEDFEPQNAVDTKAISIL